MNYLDTLTHPFDRKIVKVNKQAEAERKKLQSKATCAYIRNRKIEDPQYHLLSIYNNRKSVALKKGIPFTVELADIPYTGRCPILNIALTYEGDRDCSPSIDKIEPAKGYVKGNVRWISHRANRWKNDMTYEDVKILLDNYHNL